MAAYLQGSALPSTRNNTQHDAPSVARSAALTCPVSRAEAVTGTPTWSADAPPPWFTTGSVTPLAKSGSGSKVGKLQDFRRFRYVRRQRGRVILMQHARMEAGQDPDDMTARKGEDGWVKPPRVCSCGTAVAGAVGLHRGDTGAYFSGVARCSSIWACPVCSAKIRAERAADVEAAVNGWQAQGGALVFVTLTLRHKAGDPLALTLGAALEAWRRLLQGKAWQRFSDRHGVRGYVRALEVTHGTANGWHPHVHALFFLDRPLEGTALEEFRATMFDRWARYVVAAGARMPSELRGVDVRPADSHGLVVAQYLAKVQDEGAAKTQRVSNELTRLDAKAARGGSLTPFELLDRAQPGDVLDDAERARLWAEFYTATHGRRAITWSRGLRELTMPEAPEELTDEEAADEHDDAAHLMGTIPANVWRQDLQNHPDRLTDLLDAVEMGRWADVLAIVGDALLPPEPPHLQSCA